MKKQVDEKKEKVDVPIILEKIERSGSVKCPSRFIDSYNHVYNGCYMHLLMVILFQERLFEKIGQHLGTDERFDDEDSFPLEKYLLCETFIFKDAIKRGATFDYNFTLIVQQFKIKVKGDFLMNGNKITKFDCSFGKKSISQKIVKNDLKLIRKEKVLYPPFMPYRSKVLGIIAYKGIFERQRAAWLSKKLGNKSNYYKFTEKYNIAFISGVSKVYYYGEIGLGERFIVYSYIRPKKGRQKKLSFYQELYNLKGDLVAKISSEIFKVSSDTHTSQETELIGPMRFWFVKQYRRIKQEKTNQKNYLLRSFVFSVRSIYKKSRTVLIRKKENLSKETPKAQGISLGFPIKELVLDLVFHYNHTRYLFISHIVWL